MVYAPMERKEGLDHASALRKKLYNMVVDHYVVKGEESLNKALESEFER